MYTTDGAIKIFPITVPIMGFGATPFFQAPPKEELSEKTFINDIVPVQYPVSRVEYLKEQLENIMPDDPAWFDMLIRAEKLSFSSRQDELIALTHLKERWRTAGVIPYDHQIETAKKVLFDMNGRAILADEVGLGKTIEAGIIIKELILRQMAGKILILTPAGLVRQWHHEMQHKFNLVFGIQRSEYDWERTDRLIASIDKAKRSPHREIISNLHFDVLIVDEAHKLKNEKTQSYQLVNNIPRTFSLLLTATPVQNDLKELYNLIHLIRPGQLGTYREFKRDFVVDKRVPKETDKLKSLISSVLVRNRRSEGTIELVPRHVHPVSVELAPLERQLYDDISDFVREEYFVAQGKIKMMLPLLTLQREICSSPIAAAVTLEKMLNRTNHEHIRERLSSLLQLALQIEESSKARHLEELVKNIGESVIIFTEYRATQQYLRYRLQQQGFTTFAFDGSLSGSRKEWTRELFKRQGGVLISTESGGEGLNFQFCSNMINYDLPWNPMRLEQRIGRVHRLGQENDVHIYNMATKDTVEEHILYLLYEKINMFEMIIGELDTILAHVKLGKSLEGKLSEILVGSRSTEEVRDKLDQLANTILSARHDAGEENVKTRLDLW